VHDDLVVKMIAQEARNVAQLFVAAGALRVLNRDLKACGQALDECLKPPSKA
jgi:hypothetical protein